MIFVDSNVPMCVVGAPHPNQERATVLSYGIPQIRVARALLANIPDISARDALHIAVMRAAGCSRVLIFDAGFDNCPGITRIG